MSRNQNNTNNYNQNITTIDQTIEQIIAKISKECKVKSLKINMNNIVGAINEARISELLLLVARNTAFITIPTIILLNIINSWQTINFFPHNLEATESLNYALLLGFGTLIGTSIFNLQRNNDKYFKHIINKISKNRDYVSQRITNNSRYNSGLLFGLNDVQKQLTNFQVVLDTIMTPSQRQNLVVYEGGQNQIQELLNSYSLNTIILFILNGHIDELTSYDKSINQVTENTFNKIQDGIDWYRDYYNNYFKYSLIGDQQLPFDTKNPLYIKDNKNDNEKYKLTYEQIINLVMEKVKNNLWEAQEKRNKLAQILNQLTNKIHSNKSPKTIKLLKNIRDSFIRKLNECDDFIQKNEQRLRNLQNSQYAHEFITKEKRKWLFSKDAVNKLYDGLLTDDILVITQFIHNDLLDILPTIKPNYKASIYQTSIYCLEEIQKNKERIILKNQQEFNEILNSNTLPRKPANFR